MLRIIKRLPFTLLLFFVFPLSAVFGAEVKLAWNASPDSPDGYQIYYGTSSGEYPLNCDAGNSTECTVSGLEENTYYFFVVRAYKGNLTSEESNEVSWVLNQLPDGTYEEEFGNAIGTDHPYTCIDTFINAGQPEQVYSASKESLNTYTWPSKTAANTIAIKWDLISIPSNAVISDAQLYLYQFASGGDENYELSVHPIINKDPDIVECTWATYDGANPWTDAENGGGGGLHDIATAEDVAITTMVNEEYKIWKVTNMVQDWVSNPSSNFGMLLSSDQTPNQASSDSYRYFIPSDSEDPNKRPKLIVRYTLGESQTPAPTDPGNSEPTASASASATTSEVNSPLSFYGDANDPDGTIIAYFWDFGDGNTASTQNPIHVFSSAGNFTVTLTVTDNNNATGTDSLNIKVGNDETPPLIVTGLTVN